MRKKLVNEKRDELKAMDPRDLIDRICAYPDQHILNWDEKNRKRPFPVGLVAKGIQEKGYQMSETQYYALIHNFAGITVPSMRVVGITFRDIDPNAIAKERISTEGVKQTYETDYTLRPEPDNPYDANAIMVLAHREDGALHQIGYLNKEFAATYPITDELQVHGYLVDYSSGHMKNVSYQLALDTERLEEYKTGHYLYESRFTFDALDRPVHIDTTDVLENSDLSPELRDAILSASHSVDRQGHGMIRVETSRPLTMSEQSETLHTLLEEPEESFRRLTPEPDMPELTDAMLMGIGDLSLDRDHADLRTYETRFTLTASVNDFESARDYLEEHSEGMAEMLREWAVSQGEPELAGKVLSIEWVLDDDMSGHIRLETLQPLTEEEASDVSDWISGQNSDGIGEGFEQQPFASYEDEAFGYQDFGDMDEYEEPEYIMASFDWETNHYPLHEVAEEAVQSQEPVSQGYVYERPFHLNGFVRDPQAATEYSKSLQLAEGLNEDMELYHTNGEPPVFTDAEWEFTGNQEGVARVTADRPLTDSDRTMVNIWMDYQQGIGSLASHLREQPYTKVSFQQDLFKDEPAPLQAVSSDLSLSDADLNFLHEERLEQ